MPPKKKLDMVVDRIISECDDRGQSALFVVLKGDCFLVNVIVAFQLIVSFREGI